MTKEQFLSELQNRLSFLPSSEVAPFISYYREMIEDRMEEGMSERDAVAGLGDIGRIVEVIQYEMPVTSLVVSSVKEKTHEARAKAESRWPAWGKGLVIALLVIGSPIWLSLLAAGLAVFLGLLAVKIAVIVAVAAVVLAMAVASVAAIVGGCVLLFREPAAGVALIGAGLLGIGLTILAYLLAVIIIKGIIQLIKLLFHWLKGLFVKKEARHE
ncbi:MAG: DUF1700 domain-containing protein [Firmicutes bacterium]|nr:DUF1700 domain-containing protein [Bacillota bacterium]